ncbi:putative aminoacyltransferase, E1 ubiquitin-activating enzyme [Rosa chinensis]|uniref:Putative aminoacyltransferase, E1 ubiquitin-activating enzyme n=1 Tax=Rosa chinensis TaxID=74649 RepID=A0A2P6QGR8_ROSCH|nr:E3 ubiquitin-protein ligase RZFP34 isoform X2 [Rosa chinensis]PRQ33375.1 putative aminoacyltransferase, E1 ubiquitin-activating enzyme [Rosa chinensis]
METMPCFYRSERKEFGHEDHSSLAELGAGNFGCSHYKRRCKIRAPCCNEVYDCRHCHDEAKDSLDTDPLDRHVISRHEVKKVICCLCGIEQDVQQHCVSCGVCMGKYFCAICNFYDDDVSKDIYHCDKCGICRIGGGENFFHCEKCGCCYPKSVKDHRCIERAMHHNCPVCFEFLFDSRRDISILRCGHTIHCECLKEMRLHAQYSCPICSKSVYDMSNLWKKLDELVASTPMPHAYRTKMVGILCNDCGAKGEVSFHIVAHKCLSCNSYNTKQTQGGHGASCLSDHVAEIVR